MLAQLIDGLNSRLKQAMDSGDYDEVRTVDSACLRFLQENLPPTANDADELAAIMESLQRLRATYGEAVTVCVTARNELQDSLQTAGQGHRNTLRYLDVARNLG